MLERAVPVGQWLGGTGEPPHLVALDSTEAGTVLRGRIPGSSWAAVGAGLTPGRAPSAVKLDADRYVLKASSQEGPQLLLTPRLVIEDASGLRGACTLPPVLADGKAHEITGCAPLPEGAKVVAMAADVELDPAADPDDITPIVSTMNLQMRLPGVLEGETWSAKESGADQIAPVTGVRGEVTSSGADVVLTVSASTKIADLDYVNGSIMVTGFERPDVVPVAVSQHFADLLGTGPGKRFDLSLGINTVPVEVTTVVPDVPSVPGRAAVLADIDTLSRALIVRGDLSGVGNAWWVGDPDDPGAAAGLGLGEVTTRDAVHRELSSGPLRVGVPAALIVLVPAVLLLAVGGLTMHIVSDLRVRAAETQRLRSLGLPRSAVRGLLLAQHGGLVVLLTGAGIAVGALAARLVGPLLIRSDLGAAPAPEALLVWPWLPETLWIVGLLGLGLVVVRLVAQVQVRR
ncbi:ABC transporter permease family protein [Kineosporia succinea]